MALTIDGSTGAVWWSYHKAATLGPWSITADPSGGTLTAKVIDADDIKLAQHGLTFQWDRQTGPAWSWPVHSLHVAAGTLVAQLGPQE